MIVAQIMERKVQYWVRSNGHIQFGGVIRGETIGISIVGKRYLITTSHDGHYSGAIWADAIQRGEANDVPVS